MESALRTRADSSAIFCEDSRICHLQEFAFFSIRQGVTPMTVQEPASPEGGEGEARTPSRRHSLRLRPRASLEEGEGER